MRFYHAQYLKCTQILFNLYNLKSLKVVEKAMRNSFTF